MRVNSPWNLLGSGSATSPEPVTEPGIERELLEPELGHVLAPEPVLGLGIGHGNVLELALLTEPAQSPVLGRAEIVLENQPQVVLEPVAEMKGLQT